MLFFSPIQQFFSEAACSLSMSLDSLSLDHFPLAVSGSSICIALQTQVSSTTSLYFCKTNFSSSILSVGFKFYHKDYTNLKVNFNGHSLKKKNPRFPLGEK